MGFEIKTENVFQTIELGKKLSECLDKNDIVLLQGDLGAGKTHFTKGIAIGLGIKDMVTSPTFTLMNEYRGGRLPLYHYDMYRISTDDEIYELGLNDFFDNDGVCVIEWNVFTGFKSEPLKVDITIVDENIRRFCFSGNQRLINKLKNIL